MSGVRDRVGELQPRRDFPQLPRIVDAEPAEGCARCPHARIEAGHPGRRGAEGIECDCATWEVIRQCAQKRIHDVRRQVHRHALREDPRRAIVGDRGQPAQIRQRRPDRLVPGPLRVEAATQFDDVGEVDVEPTHGGRRIQPEHPAVQPAAQMKHDGVGVTRKEFGRPEVKLSGAHGNGERVDLEPVEVVVDAADSVLGHLVAQNWIGRAALQGSAVQGREQRFFFLGELNPFGIHDHQLSRRGRDAVPRCRALGT